MMNDLQMFLFLLLLVHYTIVEKPITTNILLMIFERPVKVELARLEFVVVFIAFVVVVVVNNIFLLVIPNVCQSIPHTRF